MADSFKRIADAVMKGLPGTSAHIAFLPNSTVALIAVGPYFENRNDEDRKNLVINAIVGAGLSPNRLSGIHCHTYKEYKTRLRNDVLAFPDEEFRLTVLLMREPEAGDTLDVEWIGPIDDSEAASSGATITATRVERVSDGIYNIFGTVPGSYQPGVYRTAKARILNRNGEIVEEIADVMKQYLAVQTIDGKAPA